MNEETGAVPEREGQAKEIRPLLFVVSVLVIASVTLAACLVLLSEGIASLRLSIALAAVGGILGGVLASYHVRSIRWTAVLPPLAMALVVVAVPLALIVAVPAET